MIDNAVSEGQIRAIVDGWVKAVRAKDVDGAIANYARDVLLFDVVNPLRRVGVEGARQRVEEWFASFQGPIGYENRDLSITAGDDVAFCHSLNQVSGTTTDGKTIEMWWRATVCFRKSGGKWMVTHAHSSVPFDPESGKASLALEP